MKNTTFPLMIAALSVVAIGIPSPIRAADGESARVRIAAAPTTGRFPLAPLDTPSFATLGSEALDTTASGHVPNYLRVLAGTHPDAVKPFAHLFKTVVYGGTIDADTKAAIGLGIARATGSPYLQAHLRRLLQVTPHGKALSEAIDNARMATLSPKEKIAVAYAMNLTRAVHGVDDRQFAEVRTAFNDAQIVELTITTCFFNYFSRLCQGSGVPIEEWIQSAPDALPPAREENKLGVPRITLASDNEMQLASTLIVPNPDVKKGLGIGIANSQRAMLRVPDMASAWWDYWKAIRDTATVPRAMQLQVSFAVSMANGCRYCTLHQVAGLRRVNVDIAKLQAMQKDDSALTTDEKAAVVFARKLTRSPQAFADADFAAMKTAFPQDKAAMEILLQTCAFNFMNRFTDGLRLPSEDEAVHVYQEVYGDGAYSAYPMN